MNRRWNHCGPMKDTGGSEAGPMTLVRRRTHSNAQFDAAALLCARQQCTFHSKICLRCSPGSDTLDWMEGVGKWGLRRLLMRQRRLIQRHLQTPVSLLHGMFGHHTRHWLEWPPSGRGTEGIPLVGAIQPLLQARGCCQVHPVVHGLH